MNRLRSFKQFVKNKTGLAGLHERMKKIQESLGRIEGRQIKHYADNLNYAEFRVFSQWGEDGIIQYLIDKVPIERKIFVEFGVENYTEANTRFLLINNYWSGLVMDGSAKNINYIKNDFQIYWGYNLKAEHAFITKENINDLIMSKGINGDIGLLSIDIDGNDYWVWEAINCIKPRIIICEYNSIFGKSAKVTVPYRADFNRQDAHYSGVYYGASLAAFHDLANKKGYSLVGTDLSGNDAFFVRKDLVANLKVFSPQEAYHKIQCREAMDEKGSLAYEDSDSIYNKIKHLDVYDIESNANIKIKDISLC